MDWIGDFLSKLNSIKYEIIWTIIVIVITSFARWGLGIFINNKIKKPAIKYRWRKISNYAIYLLGFLLIIPLWLDGFSTFFTFFGLFSAGVAIALRDIFTSFVGWLFIILKRPFILGDRIEIDGIAGDIIDIRLFQFSMIEIGEWVDAEQSTGRIVHIPNNKILTHKVANYTAGFPFIWNELPVTITFESDWEKAKGILLDIANKHANIRDIDVREKIKKASNKYLIYFGKLTPIVYTKVAESGITLTIRYLCEPHKRRTSAGVIWEDVLNTFKKEKDIELAYPTTRFYMRSKGDNTNKKNQKEGEIGYE